MVIVCQDFPSLTNFRLHRERERERRGEGALIRDEQNRRNRSDTRRRKDIQTKIRTFFFVEGKYKLIYS